MDFLNFKMLSWHFVKAISAGDWEKALSVQDKIKYEMTLLLAQMKKTK